MTRLPDWEPQPIDGVPDGLIVFDGVCVFCSRWVRFVIERDAGARFRFTPVQSAYGSALAAACSIVASPLKTKTASAPACRAIAMSV